MTSNTPSYTYEQAGVSIDAGNRLVKAIGPLVKATARPGADGEIGGFGGFFDPRAAGYKDPLLVAGNDGVGTKVKIAIDQTFPLAEVAEAHRSLEARKTTGCTILTL